MVELYRGTAALLEREDSPPKSTIPELEPVVREVKISGGTQDTSITVIENPSTYGYIGMLLSKYYQQRLQRSELVDVRHIRVNKENAIEKFGRYNQATMLKAAESVDYNFVITDSGLLLPTFNKLPYVIAFINPSQYNNFISELDQVEKSKKDRGTVPKLIDVLVEKVDEQEQALLQAMYRLLAEKIPEFFVAEGRLAVPADYASLRMKQ